MRSKKELEIAMPGSSSWMPSAPQGVNGLDDDEFQQNLEFSSGVYNDIRFI